jgi:biopolymer transport protein ExbD
MAMNVGQSRGGDDEVMVDINTTPLIDVMLVLLIMLIITIPVQTHAVKLDLPDPNANPPQTTLPPVVNVEIDFDGTILWDGNVIPDRATLESRLAQASQQQPQPEFHVRPNSLVEYKYVTEVMASAQRLGIRSIGLVGNEQFAGAGT